MQERTLTIAGLAGIDVSHFQGTVDWSMVKSAGIEFAYLKATDGTSMQDQLFLQNRAGCKANGIPSGAYHFFRPREPVSPQVDLFIKTIGKLEPGDLPPVLDVEVPADWSALSIPTRVAIINEWLDAINTKLNTKAILYLNPSMFKDTLGSSSALTIHPLWLALYPRVPKSQPTVPTGWKTWTFWQHGMTGFVSGVKGNVDVDRFNGDLSTLSALGAK